MGVHRCIRGRIATHFGRENHGSVELQVISDGNNAREQVVMVVVVVNGTSFLITCWRG